MLPGRRMDSGFDGIIRTVTTFNCDGCCEPAAEDACSSLFLLLTKEPVEEPVVVKTGVVYGGDNSRVLRALACRKTMMTTLQLIYMISCIFQLKKKKLTSQST
ncbi:hypothetical protein Ancab_029967 [Ancistrocladus abbreviatus]